MEHTHVLYSFIFYSYINIMRYSMFLAFMACTLTVAAQRTETLIRNWRFSHSDNPAQAAPDYNDRKWERVRVPHDWAIDGPFDKEIDKQVVAIEQNGEKEATEKTGRSGSLPWIGCGWYRTTIDVAPDAERVILNFDGAMAEPEVYVDGQKAGEWKYGYNAFNIDITEYVIAHRPSSTVSQQHTIAVRLQNLEESSRWYPGAGLFRPVTLIQTHHTAFEQWGLNAVTLSLNNNRTVTEQLSAVVANAEGKNLTVEFDVQADTRQRIMFAARVGADGKAMVTETYGGVRPWSPEHPHLYHLTASLYETKDDGSRVMLDQVTKKIGYRTVSCSAEGGFQLNGVTRKIKGVCLHHDLGMLGAAVNKAALERQLRLLKTMGCDAIRTSHNMPSQMQMDLCDSLGLMVMAESFDMWVYPKCKNGYARWFNVKAEDSDYTWSDRDIENLVLANRLHPSIVMWSVGNEIPEQGSEDGAMMLRHLQNQIHRFDSSRPITNGMDRAQDAVRTGFANVSECPGMNYRTHIYDEIYSKTGHGFILGSETASTVSSRGVYKFPVVRADGKAYADGQCSSYDTEACWWSNIPEEDWLLQDEKPWVIGEFVWTGFDYLGEPTPYDEYWPSRSSYFGIFDLAGLPKDRYYLYRSRWNTDEPTTHILPHWSWTGREGEVTPVYVYTSYPAAELFVNGKSQGKRFKHAEVVKGAGRNGRIEDVNDPAIDRYRLRWNDVKYEAGDISVQYYNEKGETVCEDVLTTAGKAAALKITGDEILDGGNVRDLKADADDMVFLTVSAVDASGVLCPFASNQIKVDVKGAAVFKGICNGDATSLESFTRPTMKLFNGKLVIGIQSKDVSGPVTVTVKATGLKPATVSLQSVK